MGIGLKFLFLLQNMLKLKLSMNYESIFNTLCSRIQEIIYFGRCSTHNFLKKFKPVVIYKITTITKF